MTSIDKEIRGWIEDGARELGIEAVVLPEAEAAVINAFLRDRYVNGNPIAWSWALKPPYIHFDSTKTKLSEVLPTLDGEVYLIPDTPEVNNPVFKIRAAEVESVILNCPGFEYSIANMNGDWLVAEFHHDVFLVSKYPR